MAQGKEFTTAQREKIIQSLQEYLELGFSRNKACKMVGLAPQTLSNWVQKDEALGIKMQGWENKINARAIQNIRDAINAESLLKEDTKKETTRWWLERRMKEDFSTRQDVTSNDEKIQAGVIILPAKDSE